MAGRPTPPRALNHQLVLGRKICVSERLDMHLLWTDGQIFLKPLPASLLQPAFWDGWLLCRQDRDCLQKLSQGTNAQHCDRQQVRRCGLGLLYSYAALIRHESDFHIPCDSRLLPDEITWMKWQQLVRQLYLEHIYSQVDRRFWYGELRLSRLNKICHLSQRPLLQGYFSPWHQYGTCLADNFEWLASITVYIVVVLTAMQVGLATDKLAENSRFQSASYGFTVFSILGPLVVTRFILVAFGVVFVVNWVATSAYHQGRVRVMNSGSRSA